MPRKRTASARMRKVMAARIARPATIAARIEAFGAAQRPTARIQRQPARTETHRRGV